MWADDYGGLSAEVLALFEGLEVFDAEDPGVRIQFRTIDTPEEQAARRRAARRPREPVLAAPPKSVPEPRVATCHPEVKPHAKGICARCYRAQQARDRRAALTTARRAARQAAA